MNVDLLDKKISKKVVKLILAVRYANDTDLILLHALASVEMDLRKSKNQVMYDVESKALQLKIRDNNDIINLLDK